MESIFNMSIEIHSLIIKNTYSSTCPYAFTKIIHILDFKENMHFLKQKYYLKNYDHNVIKFELTNKAKNMGPFIWEKSLLVEKNFS